MPTIVVDQISKKFGPQTAVDQASFSVEPGEIFGLLGPNGAGKTTIIRIILDIFKADSGNVSIMGGPMTEGKKNRLGYLPEERGLYQDVQLDRSLVYLSTLKGLSGPEAARKVDEYLQRFDLYEHRNKKIKELSKGMQQKAQLIVTLIHNPELVIIDEPFSALDPVNTQMVKDLLREEREKGKCIVMCTHQMHQVEELADRLVLINEGKVVLYGGLQEIQRSYSGQDVRVHSLGAISNTLPGIASIEPENSGSRIHLQAGTSPQKLLQTLVENGVQLEKFEIAIPTLDEIFIQVVTAEGRPQ
ncbi:MAG TPA: ATP-binding cassette domain-containing protein [Bellilinea sp.]|nr:ATP-binding cassette domain-containing protein [Bellilinea sp.]